MRSLLPACKAEAGAGRCPLNRLRGADAASLLGRELKEDSSDSEELLTASVQVSLHARRWHRHAR